MKLIEKEIKGLTKNLENLSQEEQFYLDFLKDIKDGYQVFYCTTTGSSYELLNVEKFVVDLIEIGAIGQGGVWTYYDKIKSGNLKKIVVGAYKEIQGMKSKDLIWEV